MFFVTFRVKQIQNELGTQILADFEEALSVKGVKVSELTQYTCYQHFYLYSY